MLVGHIVTRTRLLVQLSQTISGLLEAILEGDQMELGRDHRWSLVAMLLLGSLMTFVLMVALVVGHGVQIACVWLLLG